MSKNLYPRFWPKARHLIRYGGQFAPLIIDRAAGRFVYDADERHAPSSTSPRGR